MGMLKKDNDRIRFDHDDALHQLRLVERAHTHAIEGASENYRSEKEGLKSSLTDQEVAILEDDWELTIETDVSQIKQHINKAFLMAGFGIFEDNLLKVTDAFLIASERSERMSDLEKYKFKKCEKVCNGFPALKGIFKSELWEEINVSRRLRNQLAHDNGIFDDSESDKSLRSELLSRFYGVSFQRFGTIQTSIIILEDFFVRHALANYKSFLNHMNTQFSVALQAV